MIACSGAQVHLSAEDRDIFDQRLPADFVTDLYRICDAERCVATVTVADRVLLKLDGEPDRKLMMPEMSWVRQLEGAADSLPRVAAIQGGRVNARIREELEPRYRERVHFFDSIGPDRQDHSDDHRVDREQGCGAAGGVPRTWSCEPRDVVAFGDAENDIEMFRVAGASVAMGQAMREVKAMATAVTSRNDEAGVARAIERLLANGEVG